MTIVIRGRERSRAGQAGQAGIRAACLLSAVLCGCQAPSQPGPPPAPPGQARRFPPTGADAPLLPLFQALDRAGAEPVTILQIGDSHTANDSFASALRDRFQARFGAAGRGMLQPGIPFAWYRPEGVHVTSTGFTAVPAFAMSHIVCTVLKTRPRGARHAVAAKTCHAEGPSGYGLPGPFGIASVRQVAQGPAEATLSIADGSTIGFAEAEFMAQPGGGHVQAAAGAAPVTLSTAGAGPVWLRVPAAAWASSFTVQALGDGPVSWLGWRVLRGTPGIALANLGIPGSTIAMLDRWDPALAQAELAHLHPALILLAFGTNEGFKPALDVAAYEADFERHLAFLHASAPDAAIVVFGAPDGERLHGAPAAGSCGGGWNIPLYLPQVRQAARQAAAAQGAYYWDWQAAMGGECAMARWAAATPPLGMPDHVHMRSDGYAITAGVLFDTLMRGYARYTGGPGA